jgi:hypothetical protein
MSLANSRHIDYVTLPLFENLEERLLLTTVFGGEVFEYIDAGNPPDQSRGHLIRVALRGDIIAELIGVDINHRDNSPIIGNVPGTILTSDLGRTGDLYGGLSGAHGGAKLIGPTPISDSAYPPGNIAYVPAGSGLITIQALASMDALDGGLTYGFNVATVPAGSTQRPIVQLVQLSNSSGHADVQSMLQQASLREDVMSSLSTALPAVRAFAIDPITGAAYAINEDATTAKSVLYVIERTTGTTTRIGAITNGTTGNALSNVQAMALDRKSVV